MTMLQQAALQLPMWMGKASETQVNLSPCVIEDRCLEYPRATILMNDKLPRPDRDYFKSHLLPL